MLLLARPWQTRQAASVLAKAPAFTGYTAHGSLHQPQLDKCLLYPLGPIHQHLTH